MFTQRFKDKVMVVTGGTSGIIDRRKRQYGRLKSGGSIAFLYSVGKLCGDWIPDGTL